MRLQSLDYLAPIEAGLATWISHPASFTRKHGVRCDAAFCFKIAHAVAQFSDKVCICAGDDWLVLCLCQIEGALILVVRASRVEYFDHIDGLSEFIDRTMPMIRMRENADSALSLNSLDHFKRVTRMNLFL